MKRSPAQISKEIAKESRLISSLNEIIEIHKSNLNLLKTEFEEAKNSCNHKWSYLNTLMIVDEIVDIYFCNHCASEEEVVRAEASLSGDEPLQPSSF